MMLMKTRHIMNFFFLVIGIAVTDHVDSIPVIDYINNYHNRSLKMSSPFNPCAASSVHPMSSSVVPLDHNQPLYMLTG